MGVPQQVRKQLEDAEKLSEQVYGKQELTEAPQDGDPEDDGAAQAEASNQDETTGDKATSFESEDEGTSTDTGGYAKEGPSDDASALEHKYKTLQGMYNSEKRRNADLSSRVQLLETELNKLQQAATQMQAAAGGGEVSDQEAKPASLLTDDDLSDYGADLIDVMKRAAKEAVSSELDSLREENSRLKQVVGEVDQRMVMSDRDKLYARLDQAVGNWRAVNTDPEFLSWLDEHDPYAGVPRRDLLGRAFQANQAERVAQFFLGFLKESAAITSGQPAETAPASDRGEDKRVDLASLASPGRGSSSKEADVTRKGSGRMWKESEIGAFYEKVRRGAYKGREDDIKRVERQIQTALSTGNILVGR